MRHQLPAHRNSPFESLVRNDCLVQEPALASGGSRPVYAILQQAFEYLVAPLTLSDAELQSAAEPIDYRPLPFSIDEPADKLDVIRRVMPRAINPVGRGAHLRVVTVASIAERQTGIRRCS